MEILIPGGGDAVDLSPVNAAAADIRKGKTIVDRNGNPLVGTMAEQGGGTYTPGTADRTLVAANRYVTGNVVMKGDSNLKAANIKKGVNILGITGTKIRFNITLVFPLFKAKKGGLLCL